MNLLLRPVRSSVGTKYVMAITGLGLMAFVVAHMGGNLLIYLGRDTINAYGHALESNPVLLWTARLSLLVFFLIHVTLGIRATLQDRAARPTPYVYEAAIQATWASRHMLLTGLVLLAFILYHLLHFTFGITDPSHFKYEIPLAARGYYDVASMVVGGFQQWPVSLGYLVAQVFLGLHLWHGAGSWFQHLGLNCRGCQKMIHRFAVGLASIVVVGNCSIPLAILLGWQPH
jgi:succinate dehydrogenase / fumarate reductase cytochrome b subunit